MTVVQKTSLRNQIILESTALLSFAYIAGSKRFIQYFPGISRKDLLIGAGLSCVGSCFSEVVSRKYPEKSFFIALLLKTSFVVLPTLFLVVYKNRSMTELYQHQLKLGKADPQLLKEIQVPLRSALKFGVLERLVMATMNGGRGFLRLGEEIRLEREEEESVLKQQLEDSNNALQQANDCLDKEREQFAGDLRKIQEAYVAECKESESLKGELKEKLAELEIVYYVMKHPRSRRAG